MNKFIEFFSCILLFSDHIQAETGVIWDYSEKVVKVGLDQNTSSIDFPFSVGSGSIFVISDLGRSCGCTVAKNSKKEYDGPTSGEIHVDISTLELFAPTSPYITVIGKLSGQPYAKSLKIHLQPDTPFDISTRFCAWSIAEKISAAQVIINPKSITALHLRISIVSSGFRASLTELPNGGKVLKIFPESTDLPLEGSCTLVTDSSHKRFQSILIALSVR
jgi:hypothetical protein